MAKTRRQIWFWTVTHCVVVLLFGMTVFASFPVRSVAASIIWALLAAETALPIAMLRRFLRQIEHHSPDTLELASRIAFLGYTPLWGGLLLVQLCVMHYR